MKPIFLFLVTFALMFESTIFGQNPPIWSPFQGRMNFAAADAKCRELGMRLPTQDEIRTAMRNKVVANQNWIADGNDFWTSDPVNGPESTTMWVIFINSGLSNMLARNFISGVRCRRLN